MPSSFLLPLLTTGLLLLAQPEPGSCGHPLVAGWSCPNQNNGQQLTAVDPFGVEGKQYIYTDPTLVGTTTLMFFAVSGGSQCPACRAHPLRQDPNDANQLQVGLVPPGLNGSLLTWTTVPGCDPTTVHAFLWGAAAYPSDRLLLICSPHPTPGSPLFLLLLDPATLTVASTTPLTTANGGAYFPYDPQASFRYAVPTADGLLLYRVTGASQCYPGAELLIKVVGTQVVATAAETWKPLVPDSMLARMGTVMTPEGEVGYAIGSCNFGTPLRPVLRFDVATLHFSLVGYMQLQAPWAASFGLNWVDQHFLINKDQTFSTGCFALGRNNGRNPIPHFFGYCRGSLLQLNSTRAFNYTTINPIFLASGLNV